MSNKLNNKLMAERIKQAREEKGYTQDDIAQELGLNKSTIQRYENEVIKTAKLPVLEALANFLGVSYHWLVGLSEKNI